MLETKLKLDYSICGICEKVPVIIVAAGSSTRMGTNKQFIELGGIPVIARTLKAFESCESISNIILVVRTDDLFQMQMMCEKYKISKISDIVCGGDTRQESVLNGFARLGGDCKSVLIHDGARPFVSRSVICAVVEALENHSAALPAVRVKDTVKRVDNDGLVLETVPREDLVYVQTPQGVNVKEYLSAVEKVDVARFTDDASIMEAAGYSVSVVEGSYKNIKITTKEDIALANVFLSEEE